MCRFYSKMSKCTRRTRILQKQRRGLQLYVFLNVFFIKFVIKLYAAVLAEL